MRKIYIIFTIILVSFFNFQNVYSRDNSIQIENKKNVQIIKEGEFSGYSINLLYGQGKTVDLYYDSDFYCYLSEREEKNIKISPQIPDEAEAPIRKGQVLGSVHILLDDKILAIANLVAREDIYTHWAGGIVKALQEKNIMSGVGDEISLYDNATLGQFCAFLDELCGSDSGIDYSDERYSDYVTRADICIVIAKAFQLTSKDSASLFSDKKDIPAYSIKYINAVTEKGILNGYADLTFKPNDFITVGECAVVINNILNSDIIGSFININYADEIDSAKRRDDFAWSKEALAEVNNAVRSCGSGISVYYKDISSGYTYTYNPDQKYFIASVIKAPYCMYVYDLASQGKCDLNKRYTYQQRHYAGGTGKIRYMSFGTSFTLRELLSYAIMYSDNAAMKIIKENFPVDGYKNYVKSLNLKYPEDIKNATDGNITANDAGIYIEAIYNFIHSNTYGEELRKLMLSTSNPMIVSKYPVVRKYGWADASFHDMAIIEGENRQYLLCICSNHDGGDYNSFKKISQVIEKHSQG